MNKYLSAALAAIIGLVLLGPLGALIALLVWAVVQTTSNNNPKK